MEVSTLLARATPFADGRPHEQNGDAQPEDTNNAHQYATRQAGSFSAPNFISATEVAYPATNSPSQPARGLNGVGPHRPPPRHITFQLLLQDDNQPQPQPHRLKLRVNINPHDTTDSIITTVKNFYGLYEGRGLVFEDGAGTTLIAHYENFEHNMTVYVRVVNEDIEARLAKRDSQSHASALGNDVHEMAPPPPAGSYQTFNEAGVSRPSSRTARKRSLSPGSRGRGRRSVSANANSRPRGGRSSHAPPNLKSRTSSTHGGNGNENNVDVANGFSDSDGGNGSVTSSRRGKSEHVASAEISLDNIVEGGRRKRAKFESSELPLFVPPQVPMTASASSVSPQRRMSNANGVSPYNRNGQPQGYPYPPPLPSPQSYGQNSEMSYGHSGTMGAPTMGAPVGNRMRSTRGSVSYNGYGSRVNYGGPTGVLPTPDPTIGSVISDEDAAIQLMRLGEASNFSSMGRTSTSTADDALSGKAEPASSGEEDGGADGYASDAASSAGTASTAGSDVDLCDNHGHPQALQQHRPTTIHGYPYGRAIESDADDSDHDARQNGIFKTENEDSTHRAIAHVAPLAAPNKPKKTKATASAGGNAHAKRQPSHAVGANASGSRPPAKKQRTGAGTTVGKPVHGHAGKSMKVSATPRNNFSHSHAPQHQHRAPMSPPASIPAAAASRKTSAASVQGLPHAIHTNIGGAMAGGNGAHTPLSPASAATSTQQFSDGEEDLSTKPRCQRCRKSKKGCDRSRPCGRCRDAGIGIEGCVSEDEGNGRKGRYGRHMGVPIKKGAVGGLTPQPQAQQFGQHPQQQVPMGNGQAGAVATAPAAQFEGLGNGGADGGADKSKKRKR
ncbi:hypothetical protein BDY21DRAFT_368252 [Lineolata rhizophorae]|uniref:Zn(2)-C6 fungal-type domain-containing protein n=1 Tax=Lineolata rhizophorae TaxID=578093 RepID=A0A6A6PEG4_9PEZI|nr:hypothetical protein BDY21DRAFT_368252 [Lineolata rhizophorae]